MTLDAADCLIASESTVLGEAIYAGVPTVSLNFQRSNSRPKLGVETYIEPTCHKFLTVYDEPEKVADALFLSATFSRKESVELCRQAWHRMFSCGRTEGLVRLNKLVDCLMRRTARTGD
ncbi:MAG: hypothetical protein HY711_04555 [Candidatus Melainabacteria bacterium]|nr:hypothetical protein [Candidatus Melainabacteria bacterium]